MGRYVGITWEFKIDEDCDKSYPAQIVDMLLMERDDAHIWSWSVTDIEEFEPGE